MTPTHRVPFVKAYDIVGYTYRADTYCDGCVVEAMIGGGIASPAARDMPLTEVMWQCSQALGIDHLDEYSYDSDEFPKVIFASDTEGDDICGGCGETL